MFLTLVESLRGTQFRQWATKRLNEYIRKGFTMDDERLKNLGGSGYWKELIKNRKTTPPTPSLPTGIRTIFCKRHSRGG